MRYRITAPAEGHTGTVAGVAFHDGTAEVDGGERAALAYFRRRGYQVQPVEDGVAPLTARPAQAAPVADWRAWAVACGADQIDAEAATKAALIEQFGKSDA
jgi:hypothetical protein